MPDESPIRVLLVDDDEEAFHLTRAILDRIPSATFQLDYASSFEEGAKAVAREEHDVCLVDYVLESRSGIELVREARAALNRTPMILLTGKGRWEVDVEAMEAGAWDYLEKGKIDPDVMERTIRYAIERARAEAALRRSEARHRAMFDHLPIGLYRIGVDGVLLDANPALVQLVGYPDRRTLEVEYARNFFVSPEHRQLFLERLEGLGVLRGFESRLVRPDGRIVHVRNAARTHRDGRGRSVYVEGAVEDVSEEREVRDLQGRAARFSWIFATSGLAILLVRRDGTIQDANPEFLRTFAWQRGALRGRPFLELVAPADRDAVAGELGRITSGKLDDSKAQRRLLGTDGEILWTRLRLGLVRDANGGPDHVVVLVEDVAVA
jgi:PAS domain S-box-containing protein